MGSFNVGCGISNLTVHEGDRVGFVLLSPSPERLHGETGPHVTSRLQINATDDYVPFLPPVFGTYDDYGRIAHLEESPTTELIQSIFGRDPESVVNAAGSGSDFYGSYSDMASVYPLPPGMEIINTYGAAEGAQFAAAGFTPLASDETGAAYGYGDFILTKQVETTKQGEHSFETASWSGLKKGSDRPLFSNLRITSGSGIAALLNTFARATGVFPGFAQEDWAGMKLLSSLSGMFFLEEVYREMVPHTVSDDWDMKRLVAFEKEMEEFFGTLEEPDASFGKLLSFSHTEWLRRNTGFPVAEHDTKLSLLRGTRELSAFYTFVPLMTLVNRPLRPSFGGPQFGDDQASQALLAVSNSIVETRLLGMDD